MRDDDVVTRTWLTQCVCVPYDRTYHPCSNSAISFSETITIIILLLLFAVLHFWLVNRWPCHAGLRCSIKSAAKKIIFWIIFTIGGRRQWSDPAATSSSPTDPRRHSSEAPNSGRAPGLQPSRGLFEHVVRATLLWRWTCRRFCTVCWSSRSPTEPTRTRKVSTT